VKNEKENIDMGFVCCYVVFIRIGDINKRDKQHRFKNSGTV
jgi:hypothetical protein